MQNTLCNRLFSLITYHLPLITAVILLSGCSAPPQRVVTGKGFSLYCSLSAREAESYRCETEWTLRDLSNELGIEAPDGAVKVFLFDSRWALFRFLNDCCPSQRWAGAACFETPDANIVALSRRWPDAETLRLLRHEVTHAAIDSRYCEVPPWIHEGLAQIFELGPPCQGIHPALIRSLARAARHNTEPILPKLVAKPCGEKLSRVEYAEAWGLAHFLMNETPYGPVVVRSYLKIVSSGGDPQKQFAAVFGRTPAELEPEWRAYVLAMQMGSELH